MKKSVKAMLSGVAVFALLASPFIPPAVTVEATAGDFSYQSGFAFDESVFSNGGSVNEVSGSGATFGSASYSSTKCELTAGGNEVQKGGSITLTWNTSGFSNLTINGESVSGSRGSKTYTNIQNDTLYTLRGTSNTGSDCSAQVRISCLSDPTPKVCELEVNKTVDKASAIPGDTLTYTITVKNTGDADCTGGGVRVFDAVDSQLTYKTYTLSGDVSAGYGGNSVYTASDRTLRFNAHTLTPGESVTVKWTGEVNEPAQCGDFTVRNQSKATARELNNFQEWSYSQTVTTEIENSCHTSVCEKANVTAKFTANEDNYFKVLFKNSNDCEYKVGATSYRVPVDDDGLLCNWENHKLDCQERHDYNDITLAPHGEQEVTVAKPNKCYQLDWYYGVSVEKLDYSKFGDPILSYVINAVTGEDRLYGALVRASLEECRDPRPVPSCDLFESRPSSVVLGEAITLKWNTTNAEQVYINNGIGRVDQLYGFDGSVSYTPLADTSFLLTVMGTEGQEDYCELDVNVYEETRPICESFTATPNSLPYGGGSVTLDWEVSHADDVSIAPTVGAVGLVGQRILPVTQSTTFVLTATDDEGHEVTCPAPVAVGDPTPKPFSCANNVTFNASDRSIKRGQDITLNWNVTGADSVSIDKINKTSFSGSQEVSPSSDITYTLTAKKGDETVSCPLSIDVSSGGGGGGSVSPRCELKISDKKIKKGETVTISWKTSNASEVTLFGDRDEVIFSTDDYLAKDKDKYFDDSIKIKPTRDTTYTLLAERGSRDEECKVSVDVEGGDVVVLETRDQQPLVAGIALSQVPYTGFEAGPALTFMFYTLLVVWALFVTYLLVIRKRSITPDGRLDEVSLIDQERIADVMPSVRSSVSDSYSVSASPASVVVPGNLPIGTPIVGYENYTEKEIEHSNPHQVDDVVVTEIENRAHQQKALLSSDAVRHFIGVTAGKVERDQVLDEVIAEAKKAYPLEDGWIVINEQRMRMLCGECDKKREASTSTVTPFIPATVPEGTGSLAEAIVTGNVVAAYEMIGNRPMFALADAAADLDAVYRKRKGGDQKVSDMLIQETNRLSDAQIKDAITALTSAIDGVYTDEASAVKMAIMKAVKAVA